MLLTIVLIIFTLILGTMTLMMYLWWRKYGRDLFKTIKNMGNMMNFGKTDPFSANFGKKMPNIGDYKQQIKMLQDIMGKKPKK
jgi:hypothetical protein